MASTSKVVHARKRRRCDYRGWNCRGWILPGEAYQRTTVFPDAESPWPGVVRFATCVGCMSPSAEEIEQAARLDEREVTDSFSRVP